MKYNDYARLRNYDNKQLLSYELSAMSVHLTKDNCIKIDNKSELSRLLEDKLEKPSPKVCERNYRSMIVIDFMACARRVPVKKSKLIIFGDFARNIWDTFKCLFRNCDRVDIVFILYLEKSTKGSGRGRRTRSTAINDSIQYADQPLPVSMDGLWAPSSNKEQLQQFVITWLMSTYTGHKGLYLGVCLPGYHTGCINIKSGICTPIPMLKCDHEEADDRLMFHINHSITIDNHQEIVLASADTDIFVCSLFHFARWMYFDFQELWILCGQGLTSRAVPVDDTAALLDSEAIDIVPAVHALKGCDTTSKVDTKKAALEVAESDLSELLLSFAREPLAADII